MQRGAEATRLIAEADLRRNAGDWRGAAQAYASYLELVPTDWAIWVQHGHCVKEAGDAAGALASYRRAERGLPADADLQLQIGHALKRVGDFAGARVAYGRSLELAPEGEAAWRELSGLLGRAEAAAAEAEPAGLLLLTDLQLVLDLSDLWAWWQGSRAPSGIQRIQLGLAGAALRREGLGAVVRLAVFRPEEGHWRALPREAFWRLSTLSRARADPADPAWAEALSRTREVLEAAPPLDLPEGAWLVNPGSSWWLPDYHRAVREARARHGIRYAPLVHDCGPATLPEHVDPSMAAQFVRWFAGLSLQADLVLAVSEATRADIARLRDAHLPGLPAAPVAVLRPDAAPPAPPQAPPHPALAELAGTPFVLMVGTIESRKDHLFALNAWLALLRRLGEAVPPLVLAGRAGFGADPALSLLRRAPALAGRVRWLDDLADAHVAALYHGALFTLCTSRHEGWGLPVTEALAHGKAVVAPGHSGLLEAGQGLALHYQAGSEPAFLSLVERLLTEPGFLSAQERRIAEARRLRGWEEIAEELLGLLGAVPPGAPPAPAPPPPGTVHRLAALEGGAPRPAMAWVDLLRAGPNWHAPEDWGCWTRPGRALLRLPVAAPAGTRLRVHLALRAPAVAQAVTLRAGRDPAVVLEAAAGSRPITALETVAPEPGPAGQVLEITLEAPAAPPEAGVRAPPEAGVRVLPEAGGRVLPEAGGKVLPEAGGTLVGIGVVAAMACPPQDVTARLEFLESLSFRWPDPD